MGVTDSRVDFDGYGYQPVDGTSLPFADHSFGAVIRNHVIAHIQEQARRSHLGELRRMMRADVVRCLAPPSRCKLIEPRDHLHLAFCNWLPQTLWMPFVRMTLSIEGNSIPGVALAGRLADTALKSLRWFMHRLIFHFTRDLLLHNCEAESLSGRSA
jgi:hypothetical protein